LRGIRRISLLFLKARFRFRKLYLLNMKMMKIVKYLKSNLLLLCLMLMLLKR
jgi:hypothetical protein